MTRSALLLALVSLLAATYAQAGPVAPLLPRHAPRIIRTQRRSAVRPRQAKSSNPLVGPKQPVGSVPAGYIPIFDSDPHIKLGGGGKFQLAPSVPPSTKTNGKQRQVPAPACYPGLAATAPSIPSANATAASLSSWWCPQSTEYAFMGFSYAVDSCQSLQQLTSDFTNMRKTYKARYVRLYGSCDGMSTYDFMNNVVSAAAKSGLGVYSLVWFGFDGDDKWKARLSDLVRVIKTNRQAPYVIRSVAIGSEPLFDGVLSPDDLAAQVLATKKTLSAFGMPVTISEMPYGFQSNGNAPQVFSAIDMLCVNALPFFDSAATTGGQAWPSVSWSIDYMRQNGGNKPIRLTQTGWPSNTNVWPANSASAVASVSSEKAYFDLLDSKCSTFKSQGSVGWFAHIYDDDDLPGWGIQDSNGNLKFPFAPRTTC